MKVSTLLKILAELYPILVRESVIDAAGDFHEPDAQTWARLAGEIEAILKANGVVVQANVDRVIQALPLVLGLAGVA